MRLDNMKKSSMDKYASNGKRMIRVSYTPNTWIEVDVTLSEEEINKKVKEFRQLTGIK